MNTEVVTETDAQAAMQARLDALEAENNRLQAEKLEALSELEIWRPTQRVEVVKPLENTKPQDFATPKPLVKQFKIAELAGMNEDEVARAVKGHLTAQLDGIKSKITPNNYSSLANGFYLQSMVKALTGNSWVRRNATREVEIAVGVAYTKGFTPFVSIDELREYSAKK